MVVRMRNAGPPPLIAPSADIDLGRTLRLAELILKPGKSDHDAAAAGHIGRGMHRHRQATAQKQTVTSPEAVCRNESAETVVADKLNRDRTRSGFDLRSAAQVQQFTLPPPVVTATGPVALARRTLPPSVCGFTRTIDVAQIQIAAAAGHVQIAKALLHLDTAGSGLNRRGASGSDIDSASAQINLRLATHIATRTSAAPLVSVKSPPRLPASTLPPPLADLHRPGQIVELDQAATGRSDDASPAIELNASEPLRVSTFTRLRSRGTCTMNSAPKRGRFLLLALPSMRIAFAVLAGSDAQLIRTAAAPTSGIGSVRTFANDVGNVGRIALHLYRPDVGEDVKLARRRQACL